MLEESLLIIKLKDHQIDYVNDHFINIGNPGIPINCIFKHINL